MMTSAGNSERIHEVFGRQMEEEVSPVSKDDVAEVLRRRFFKPESIKSHEGFSAPRGEGCWQHRQYGRADPQRKAVSQRNGS